MPGFPPLWALFLGLLALAVSLWSRFSSEDLGSPTNLFKSLLDAYNGFAAGRMKKLMGLLEVQVQVRDILAVLGVFALLRWGTVAFWASQSTASEEKEKALRKHLTKLRANSHLFPPPYPNGWYVLCRSDDVPTGEVLPVSACGREFVVFRGAKGEIAVLHAFCPHLGTHLGYGGFVKGNSVVCPYHSWAFDGMGKCTEIPYCSKDTKDMGERIDTKSFPVRERLGMIFVWLHSDDEAPLYELTCLDEIEQRNMAFAADFAVDNWQMHIMEPSQNAADPYHFNTTHNWLGAKPGHRSALWVRHECRTKLGLLGSVESDGSPMDGTIIALEEGLAELRLFGLIPIPKIFFKDLKARAVFQGPQVSVLRVDYPLLGSCRIVMSFTPEAPFVQRGVVRVFRSRGFLAPAAKWLGLQSIATANQDRVVWEHKLAVAPRNCVAGDGPFAAYGQWLRQFYSPSSKNWGDTTLEW